MFTEMKKIRVLAALLPLSLAASVVSAPVGASVVTDKVHTAVRDKMMREAKDRSHISFATTHEQRLSSRLRQVTGRGIFERGHKAPQQFSYSGTMDIKNGMVSGVGYKVKH